MTEFDQRSAVTAPSGDRKMPLASVIVEGYNELQLSTSVTDVLDALAVQDYPLDRIELVLVGKEAQFREWERIGSQEGRFGRVVTIEGDSVPYYELKNRGAEHASGEVLAFTDSDVSPERGWLRSIVHAIRAGADVTAGISTMWDRTGRLPDAVVRAAASVSFAHVVGTGVDGSPASGVVAHNVGARKDAFLARPFRTGVFGRNCCIGLFYGEQLASGARITVVRAQRVAHSLSPQWFVYPFHVRVGWEEYTLRRLRADQPNRWMMRFGALEPLLTALWYVGIDVRRWFPYSRAIGLGCARRIAHLPVVLAVSLTARAAGAIGGYGAMFLPTRSRAWAERQ